MFKNLIVFRLGGVIPSDLDAFCAALSADAFVPTANTQPRSVGWVPPRGHKSGPLVEAIDGHWILKLQGESRLLPRSVVAERVEELAGQIEEQTGRKPGKKARKDLKEQATHELLPRAFTQTKATTAWINTKSALLAINATSASKADELVTMLIRAAPQLTISQLQFAESPAACMAAWLMDGVPPEHFTIDRDSLLKSPDDTKAVVKYERHPLDIDEVRAHLTSGKTPTQLAMSFNSRVSFVLTDAGTIRTVKMLDLAFEGRQVDPSADAFDGDVALATGELSLLLNSLIAALGGESDLLAVSGSLAAEVSGPGEVQASVGEAADDPLVDAAIELVRAHGTPSISLVQRHLRIGYNRAAKLLETLEAQGIVSAMNAAGARTLLHKAAA